MSRARRIAVQLPLGFGSGLPFLLTGGTLTAWLADSGTSIEAIGLFALVALPYNVKFLWAPVLDRFPLPLLGRRRGWMLCMQALLLVAIGVLGTRAPGHAMAIALAAVIVTLLSATQDIAVDAYRTESLPAEERGKGTAAHVIGYRLALIVAGSGALVLADHVSWHAVYVLMAGLMSIGMIATLLGPEPPRIAPPGSLREAIVEPLREFFTRRHALSLLVIVMLYRGGDVLVMQMIMPFLLELSFSKSEVGILQQGLGMAATIAGVAMGGAMADRLGMLRSVLYFGILQAFANFGYVLLALVGKHHALLVAALVIDNVCNGLGTAASVAFVMSLCHHRFSATQYALLTSASSVLGRFLGSAAGYLVTAVGWAGFFASTAVMAIPALILVAYLHGAQDKTERSHGHGGPESKS